MTSEQAQAIYFAGRDVVVTHLCALDEQVRALHQEIEALQRKIAQLSKDSSNSSKRPSSDDITNPKRGKNTQGVNVTNGKIGGQPGHERPPYPPETIDQVHHYESTCCPCCYNPDILFIEDQPPRVIQQAEVKEIVVHEEHLAYAYWCESCGQIHYAEFPPQLLKEGLFKARLTALVAYIEERLSRIVLEHP